MKYEKFSFLIFLYMHKHFSFMHSVLKDFVVVGVVVVVVVIVTIQFI